MKKLLSVLLCFAVVCGCVSCGDPDAESGKNSSQTENRNPDGISPTAVNAIKDEYFRRGIDILGTDSTVDKRNVFGYIDYNGTALDVGMHDSEMQRAWQLTQWASQANLAIVCSASEDKGVYIYENDYKKVAVNPETGNVTLRVNGGREYDFKPRTTETSWVHLLIEQVPTKYLYREIKSLTAYIDFSVDEITNYLDEEDYNTEIHAAQLVWYFQLYSEKGGRLWFGIPLYDNREDDRGYINGEAFSYDAGTKMVIYGMDKMDYLGEQGAKIGVRNKCVIPLESAIKFCVEQAMQRDVFAEGTTVDDCYLTSMNMGWEVPGTFDCQATFYKIGLYADLK